MQMDAGSRRKHQRKVPKNQTKLHHKNEKTKIKTIKLLIKNQVAEEKEKRKRNKRYKVLTKSPEEPG